MESSHMSRSKAPAVNQCSARRSISIFSRRGVDSLEPTTAPFPPAIMYANKSDSRRASNWKRTLSHLSKHTSHETTLRQFPPPLSVSTMSPLEHAMATSPNDEILSAIGNPIPSNHPSISALPPSQDWNMSPKSSGPRPRPSPIDESKLGAWRDGCVIWDSKNPSACSSKASRDDYPLNLSVVIPSGSNTKPVERSSSLFPEVRSSSPPFRGKWGSVSHAGSKPLVHPAFRTSETLHEEQPSHNTSSSRRSAVESLAEESLAKEPLVEEPLAEEILAEEPPSENPESLVAESLAASRSSTASYGEISDHNSSHSCSSSRTSIDEEQTNLKRVGSAALSVISPVSVEVSDEQQAHDQEAQLDDLYDVSPTLDEAEHDLHNQLGITPEEEPQDEQHSPVITELVRAPTIPRKSRKRDWKGSVSAPTPTPSNLSRSELLIRRKTMPVVRKGFQELQTSVPACQVHRSTSSCSTQTPECEMSLNSAQISLLLSAISSLGLDAASPQLPTISSPSEAQAVLFRIMSCLDSFEDLRATAVINKGMYQVFKAREVSLYQKVLWNKSPAMWEMCEWSPAEFVDLDDCVSPSQSAPPQDVNLSPSAYMDDIRKYQEIIRSLKELMLERCKSFLRIETVAALISDDDVNYQRFEDAFCRLWCFCKIFGCGKGREDDVTGQLDWLRGGLLAHHSDCAATVNINLEFDMGGVLLNAPDYFATGNPGGLSAAQLYDMMELWNCMAALLSGYQGRVDQAREFGTYQNIGVQSGNRVEEEASLEEWMSYILTLGPSVILELARFAEDHSDKGFRVARVNGWTNWELSSSGNSRHTFLREPVARLYEERIVTAVHGSGSSVELQEKKEIGRKRVASMAAEIKLARSSSVYQRLPLIDLANERSMGLMGRRDSASPRHQQAHPPHQPSTGAAYYGFWMKGKVASTIEEKVENFNRLGLVSLEGAADDTVDKAISKIVAMGFSASQAKDALKLTDMGSGLRVDRAVDVLLKKYGTKNLT